MRPDVLALQGVVERLDVPVLLGVEVYLDKLGAEARYGRGHSEPFAGVLGSVAALEGQLGSVGLGSGNGLYQRLDCNAGGGYGVKPVGDPLPGNLG